MNQSTQFSRHESESLCSLGHTLEAIRTDDCLKTRQLITHPCQGLVLEVHSATPSKLAPGLSGMVFDLSKDNSSQEISMLANYRLNTSLLIAVLVFSLGLPMHVSAKGPGLSGGGDPHAGLFMTMAIKTKLWLENHRGASTADIDSHAYAKVVRELQLSFAPGQRAKVRFVLSKLFDSKRVPKPAIFNLKTREIQVNTFAWQRYLNAGLTQQLYSQVNEEILGLMEPQPTYRYEKAEIIASHWQEIDRIPLTVENIANLPHETRPLATDEKAWPPNIVVNTSITKLADLFEGLGKLERNALVTVDRKKTDSVAIEIRPRDVAYPEGHCWLKSGAFDQVVIKLSKVDAYSTRVQIAPESIFAGKSVDKWMGAWRGFRGSQRPYTLELKVKDSAFEFFFEQTEPGDDDDFTRYWIRYSEFPAYFFVDGAVGDTHAETHYKHSWERLAPVRNENFDYGTKRCRRAWEPQGVLLKP